MKPTKKSDGGFTITGLMVTCSIIGILVPVVGELFVNLAKVQAKAANFSTAGVTASIYANQARTNKATHAVPEGCDLQSKGNEVYTITCTEGTISGTVASATRTFDIYVEPTNSNNESETNEPKVKEGPYTPGVYCPDWDPDGTKGYDNDHNVNCNPNGWW